MKNTISPCPFCGHDMEVKRIALQRSLIMQNTGGSETVQIRSA